MSQNSEQKIIIDLVNSGNEKVKRKNLSIAERCQILERLEAGERAVNLAKEFNVTKSAVSLIKKRKEDISEASNILKSCNGNMQKKRYSGIEDGLLDRKLYTWFLQKRCIGFPVTGPQLQKQARRFHNLLGLHRDFKASDGWLQLFKKRHGIRHLSIQGERVPADPAEEFKKTLADIMAVQGSGPDFIYNCDETGLYWKMLPNKTSVLKHEKGAEGWKKPKNRVTVMMCCNASGTHKLPLFVIGKSERPRCFRGVRNLPVIYRKQKSAWMNSALMAKWYTSVFLQEVKQHHNIEGTPGVKIILIMDNAFCHQSEEILNSTCDFCTIVFLPPNVTSLIQPLNRGVIENFKKSYRSILLTRLLAAEGAEEFLKSFTLLNCVNFCAVAWDRVTAADIRNCWKTLISLNDPCSDPLIIDPLTTDPLTTDPLTTDPLTTDPLTTDPLTIDPLTIDLKNIYSLLLKIPQFRSLSRREFNDWVSVDFNDSGWQIRSDESILFDTDDECIVEEMEDDIATADEEDTDERTQDNVDNTNISAKDVLNGLETYISWYQKYGNNRSVLIELQKCKQFTIETLITEKKIKL